ncbi:uncharacterized protein K02A2.6-like [Macrosteles quadrilineatus]|uniref:uncharacterized protein K02A2.6-like n=1 Tax=Macrosteles quadrilineatus TaxID=74068 RepID=UPI0023E13D80|nr:uncharacterized protein K02A2.6-like [Macrosteles quadrilineatus]
MRDLPKVVNSRLVRWALQLNQYNYDIEYRKGEDNVCADVLSRLPIEEGQPEEAQIGFLNVDKVNSIMSYDLLKQNSFTDKAIKMAKNFVLRNTWPPVVPEMLKSYKQRKDELSVEDDILLWFGRIVVPECMRTDVLKILHTGHPGIVSMRSVARHYVWWPNMDKDIEVYIKRCTYCQENRDNVEEVPLYPWNVPDRVWERVHIDLAGPVNGSMWLVGIDALSKWAEVDCLKTTNSSTIIQRLRSWFSRYGIPSEIVTDNGPQFLSKEMETFFEKNSINHIKTTPYHPKSNGLVERLIRTLKRRFYTTKQDVGDGMLALQNVLFSYRKSPQKTIGRAPAELFLGRRLPTIFDNMKPNLRKKMEMKLWKEQGRDNKKVRTFEEGEDE